MVRENVGVLIVVRLFLIGATISNTNVVVLAAKKLGTTKRRVDGEVDLGVGGTDELSGWISHSVCRSQEIGSCLRR